MALLGQLDCFYSTIIHWAMYLLSQQPQTKHLAMARLWLFQNFEAILAKANITEDYMDM